MHANAEALHQDSDNLILEHVNAERAGGAVSQISYADLMSPTLTSTLSNSTINNENKMLIFIQLCKETLFLGSMCC